MNMTVIVGVDSSEASKAALRRPRPGGFTWMSWTAISR
jgi:hypothetical protein